MESLEQEGQSPKPTQTPAKRGLAKYALVSAGVFGVLLLVFLVLLPKGGHGDGGTTTPGDPGPSPEEQASEAHEEARRSVATALQEFKGERHPSPSGAWETAIIYRILVDRFNNGDAQNDDSNLMPWDKLAREDGDYSQLGKMRHGGDLLGIKQRLPYIKDLGANTILLSPVLSHNGHYDGSCPTDPTRIDRGFGSEEEFKELVAEAHKLEIRVVMDIVVNHLCDSNVHYKESRKAGEDKVQQCASALMGKYQKGDGEVEEGLQLELELDSASYAGFRGRKDFFNRCGPGTDVQLTSMEEVALFTDVGPEKFDFDTSNSDWQELFLNLHQFWIAYADVDGFHCSGAEHVTEDFLAYFSTSLRRFAEEKVGKEDFLVVGDVEGKDWAAKRVGVMKQESQGQAVKSMLQKLDTEQPGLSTVHNLEQNRLLRGQLTGESDESALQDYYDEEATMQAEQLAPECDEQDSCGAALAKFWTELERAPLPRFASARENAPDGFSEVGLAMLLLLPGQPIINYGQEQGFSGRCPQGQGAVVCSNAEPLDRSRQDMFEAGGWCLRSTVAQIDSWAQVTTSGFPMEKMGTDWQSDHMLDRSHELYGLARGLTRLRLSCPAILRGNTVVRDVEEHRKGGAIAFSRVLKGDKGHAMEVIVVVNPHPGDAEFRKIPCDPDINSELFAYDEVRSELVEDEDEGDLEESEEGQVRYDEGHCFIVFAGHGLKVPEFSFKVLVRKDQLAAEREDGLSLRLCSPAPPEHGETTESGGEQKPADAQAPPDEEEPKDRQEPQDGQKPFDELRLAGGQTPTGAQAPADGRSTGSWAREGHLRNRRE